MPGGPDDRGDGDSSEMGKVKKQLLKAKEDLSKEKKRRVSNRLFSAAAGNSGDKKDAGAAVEVLDDDDGDDDEGSSFQSALSRNGATGTGLIQTEARIRPGNLYQAGLEETRRFLSAREGANGRVDEEAPPKMLNYLTTIFHGAHPAKECGIRTARELRTVAEAIDALGAGQLPELGDLLMQRFKALQTSVADGGWHLAKRMELIPDEADTVASFEERRLAARDELLHLKLDEARDKVRKRGSG